MDAADKQANLQRKALSILSSIPDMEKSGASEAEIEAKISEANKIIEESRNLSSKVNEEFQKRLFRKKVQMLMVTIIALSLLAYATSRFWF